MPIAARSRRFDNTTQTVAQTPNRIAASTPRRLLRLLAACTLLGCTSAAIAVEPTTPLAHLSSQTWTMDSGLPQNTVQALLQTRDGFLWLGTEAGLVRFDGIQFQVFDHNSNPALPIHSDTCCLLESSDGALWAGTSEGLLRWQSGTIRLFTTLDGLPGNVVRALDSGSNGALQAYTDLGLVEWHGARFSTSDAWRPGTHLLTLGSKGNLQIQTDHEAHWHQLAIAANLPLDNVLSIAELGHDVSALATNNAIVLLRADHIVAHLRTGHELPGSRIQTLLADREGTLWIGTNNGLARCVDGSVERLPATDALSAASVLALMEDREGNLWTGTESNGLHILRDTRFHSIGVREGLSSSATTAVTEDRDGTLWVGTQDGGLNALRREGDQMERSRSLTVQDGLASNVVLALAAAPAGDLWVGTPDGLNRIHGNSIATFTSSDGLPDDFVRSLLVDRDGSLWIGSRRGLTHWLIGNAPPGKAQMKTYTHQDGLASDLVGAMALDAKGDLWVATLAGLSRLHNGSISTFTTAHGLPGNVVTALLARSDGTLLAGTQDRHWSLWNGQKFSPVAAAEAPQASVHAMVPDASGHLWFATDSGLARCDSTPATSTHPAAVCSHWIEFGTADGLPSRETASNSRPSAWQSQDGHLWFATAKGIVEVDPAHFPINNSPPPVALERFLVDDASQPLAHPGASVRVEAGHVHFEFDYAGLSFVAPQKVRYRYMLEGFDRGWTEAGTRRTAYYTNIPPGKYIFRVRAANNDGLWSTQDAALSFELRPMFYQTLWFYALLAVIAALGGVLLMRQRLRVAKHEFNAVLGERNRIAREIHDTLAQGYVGVSVQLELLAELLRQRKVEAAEKHLDGTRAIVREGLADARQSIWALRTQDVNEFTLPIRLRRMAEAAGDSTLTASFNLFGAYRALPQETESELLRVAQEAIHNVRKHAKASQLWVQLEYGPSTITLEVRDDGCGVPNRAQDALSGHFGLKGMRERAAAIGGTLAIQSSPGTGITVRMSAPIPPSTQQSRGEPQ